MNKKKSKQHKSIEKNVIETSEFNWKHLFLYILLALALEFYTK